jgi:hypothetical protein
MSESEKRKFHVGIRVGNLNLYLARLSQHRMLERRGPMQDLPTTL